MAFQSILFDQPRHDDAETSAPDYFRDLNLGPLVEAIVDGREEYRLEPFFFTPLADETTVRYRQAVFQDFAGCRLLAPVTTFADGMRTMRKQLAQADKLKHPLQRQRWFASTNEREGSEIARHIFEGLLDSGVKVVAVTHRFDLANSLFESGPTRSLLLRAEREADGSRTFRLVIAAPRSSSPGEDVYRQVFGFNPSGPATRNERTLP